MKFDEILMICRERNQITSWEALAWHLGMTEGGLRAIRKGKGGTLKEGTLEAIMRGSGLEAPLIVATWEAEHGKNAHVRESWQRLAAAWDQKSKGEKGKDSGELEKLCIMLSKPDFAHGSGFEAFQELIALNEENEKSGLSPMGIRLGVTKTQPEEKTPAPPWHGPERRHGPGHWHGPERRAA